MLLSDAFQDVTTYSKSFQALLAAATMVAFSVAPAAGQQADRGRFSIGAGAGIATPFHGDFDFTAAAWQVDARIGTAKYVALGVFLEQWRHTDEQILTNRTLFGPGGVIGRVDRVTIRTVYATRAVGGNLLSRVPLGRVTIVAGGGVGALLYSRDFSQSLTGCESTMPGTCDNPDTSNRFTNDGFSVQAQAAVEVAITSRVGAMGQVRVLGPVQDPGAGHATFIGGMRLLF